MSYVISSSIKRQWSEGDNQMWPKQILRTDTFALEFKAQVMDQNKISLQETLKTSIIELTWVNIHLKQPIYPKVKKLVIEHKISKK